MTRRATSHTTSAPRTFRANAVMTRRAVWAMLGISMNPMASLVLGGVSWDRGAHSEDRDGVPEDARPGRGHLPLDLGPTGSARRVGRQSTAASHPAGKGGRAGVRR